MDERVEVLEQDAGERAANGKALALEAAWRGGQLADLPLAGHDGVGRGDAGEDREVVDGDRGHWVASDFVGGEVIAYATISRRHPGVNPPMPPPAAVAVP